MPNHYPEHKIKISPNNSKQATHSNFLLKIVIWHMFLSRIKLFDNKLPLPEIPISNRIMFRNGPTHESYNKHPLFDKHKIAFCVLPKNPFKYVNAFFFQSFLHSKHYIEAIIAKYINLILILVAGFLCTQGTSKPSLKIGSVNKAFLF